MSQLFFVLGLLISLNYTNPPETINTTPYISLIQQDSTPPNHGIVNVEEISEHSKKKTPNNTSKNKTNSWKKYKKLVEQKEKQREKTLKVQKNNARFILTIEDELKLLAISENIDANDIPHPDIEKKCKFAFDVTDKFTGFHRRGLYAQTIFNYTPKNYRKFLKSNDFIRCEGFLSQSSSGNMALNINFIVASKEAKYKFGGIRSNSPLILYSMKGNEYTLMTYQGAEAQIKDNTTLYECSFAINKKDIKKLKKEEIDRVKISFDKGFQAYEIFYIDFIIDQFSCFE
ncbi:MAG: hypothetical protein MK207_00660 [Saprospiraceae bacterium]|nr:hypothetical protein [Saprospiraceae bacterium]